MGRRIALLIGANSYADPHLRRLRSPVSDLQSLARVLGSAAIGGFEVRQILDVPAHQVNAEIEELFADRSREDVLLAYFSCHGIKDDSGRLYFAASNTRLNRLGSTAVSASFVHDQLEQSSSRQIVVLLDCCYSGAFANSEGLTPRSDRHVDVNERLAGTGRAIITATTAMEYAFEPQGLESVGAPGSSLFTRALVAGLESGDADLNKDGVVTVDELYSYVYDELREVTPRQTPRKQFSLSGDLVIAKNPRPVVPEALPDSVRLAIESPLAGVRREGIVALRQLVLSNGSYGRIARDTLSRLSADDSRSVASLAYETLRELPSREQASVRPPRVQPGPGTRQDRPGPASQSPHTWRLRIIDRSRDRWRQARAAHETNVISGVETAVSVAVYVVPALPWLLVRVRSGAVRFHAVLMTAIDVCTVGLFVNIGIIGAIYSGVRYGGGPIPKDDPFLEIATGVIMAVLLGSRIAGVVQVARSRCLRIPFLTDFAARRAGYGEYRRG